MDEHISDADHVALDVALMHRLDGMGVRNESFWRAWRDHLARTGKAWDGTLKAEGVNWRETGAHPFTPVDGQGVPNASSTPHKAETRIATLTAHPDCEECLRMARGLHA